MNQLVAKFVDDTPTRCTHCGRKLDTSETVWLELDHRFNDYHDFKNVPVEFSQGWFPFGKACAAKRLRSVRAALAQGEKA